jgi:SAM-dependent methyltransferase
MMQTAEYLLGTSEAERARLLTQCEIYRPAAEQLLDRIGVRLGWRAIDIGCGPLGILDLLAKRVGASSRVVGLDREPGMLKMAELSVAERNLSNVQLIQGDATATQLPSASFDLIHERLLLFHVACPQQVVAEMVRLARPGGWVALENFDAISLACEPPHPAWDRLLMMLNAAWRDAGLDLHIGRRLPGFLRTAGLVDVKVAAHAHVWQPVDLYQMLLPHFPDMLRKRMLASSRLTEAEFDELILELTTHLEHPDTLVLHLTLLQAWGRKPPAC